MCLVAAIKQVFMLYPLVMSIVSLWEEMTSMILNIAPLEITILSNPHWLLLSLSSSQRVEQRPTRLCPSQYAFTLRLTEKSKNLVKGQSRKHRNCGLNSTMRTWEEGLYIDSHVCVRPMRK